MHEISAWSRVTLGLQVVRLIGVVGSLPVISVAVFVHNQPVLFLALLLLLGMAWRDYEQIHAQRAP